MEILLNFLKILGIILASYYSYLALTKKLKNDDGSLTNYGKKSKNGIIISCVLSLLGFILGATHEESKKEKKLYGDIRFPLNDLEFYGLMEVTLLNVTKENESRLFYCKELINRMKKEKSAPNTYILQHTNDTLLDYTSFIFSNNPDSCYFSFDGATIEKFNFFQKNNFIPPFKYQGKDLYFTTNTDTSTFDNFIIKDWGTLNPNKFDLIFHLKLNKIVSASYYPNLKRMKLEVIFSSTPENKSNTIENFEDILSNAFFIYHYDLTNTITYTKIRTKSGEFFSASEIFRTYKDYGLDRGPYVVYKFIK